ncbi:sugar ABC transporter permease [Glaciihabitans sp. UYNi722]|uniref:carbohydrate ABC transporter permease n=1 Tax=Glaciihabitans sp. UYNi722 TaxID=3156344 RepID=UPI003394F2F1
MTSTVAPASYAARAAAERAPRPLGRRPGGGKDRRYEALTGYLMILPLFAGVSVLFFYPIGRSIYLSFTKTGIFRGETFVGLAQYQQLLGDSQFWASVAHTLLYALISLAAIPIAVFFAALLNVKGLRFRSFYRVLFFLPVVTMPVAVGMIWKYLFNSDFGVVNQVIGLIGIPKVAWLSQPIVVVVAIAIVGLWASLGLNIILMLSGLQTVPNDVMEAASLDGAGAVRRFMSVTLPLVTPTIFLIAVLNVIASLQVFDLVLIMIGPNSSSINSASTIVYYFYEVGFIQSNRGYAAAISVALLVLTMVVTAAQFRLQRRWVNYDR